MAPTWICKLPGADLIDMKHAYYTSVFTFMQTNMNISLWFGQKPDLFEGEFSERSSFFTENGYFIVPP